MTNKMFYRLLEEATKKFKIKWCLDDKECIRGFTEQSNYGCCPITAVFALEARYWLPIWRAVAAGASMDMGYWMKVIDAADKNPNYNGAIRKALLSHTGIASP